MDLYSGDPKDAARRANFPDPARAGIMLLGKAAIKHAIKERNGDWKTTEILTREDRQRLWSRIALGLETETIIVDGTPHEIAARMPNRLKALEMLARSEGDFFDKLKVEFGLEEELKQLSYEQIQARLRKLEADGVLELIQRGGVHMLEHTPDGER